MAGCVTPYLHVLTVLSEFGVVGVGGGEVGGPGGGGGGGVFGGGGGGAEWGAPHCQINWLRAGGGLALGRQALGE